MLRSAMNISIELPGKVSHHSTSHCTSSKSQLWWASPEYLQDIIHASSAKHSAQVSPWSCRSYQSHFTRMNQAVTYKSSDTMRTYCRWGLSSFISIPCKIMQGIMWNMGRPLVCRSTAMCQHYHYSLAHVSSPITRALSVPNTDNSPANVHAIWYNESVDDGGSEASLHP